MARIKDKLSVTQIRGLKQPGRYNDGGGLYLLVDRKTRRYWIFRYRDRITGKLLNRKVGVAITDKSGAAGIKHYIEEKYDINIAKHDPRVIAIKDKIDTEYSADRVAVISDEEMDAWIVEAFGDKLPALR